MSENKQEWFLSQKNINSTKLGIFKIHPYSRGIVVGNEKIEGKGLLELNFNQQDLEVEKFVFEKIHIVNLQIDDDMKVCIDIDKSLENFNNEFKNSSPHIVKSLEKLTPLIEASRKQSENLMKLMPLGGLSDIAKQIKASVESIKPPAIIDPTDKLNFVNYEKYFQSQAKTFYQFCFEKCTLEEVDFANEVRHNLEFKDNIFLKYCQILNKTFLERVEFLNNVFEQCVSIKECNFKKPLSFKTHKDTQEWNLAFSNSNFEGEVFIIGNKLEQAKIKSSTFYENVYFGLDRSKSPNGECGSSKINQNFILQDVVFMKKAYFERCDFPLCVIESCKFQDDTFFDYSNFGEIRILKTLFGQRASFYHATFCEPILFANCIFDKYLTMIGSKLVLNGSEFIKKVRRSANDLCVLFNDQGVGTISKPNNKCKPDDFLKDYRDGFCTIKNALIKNNNLLDASNYHKAELYCKEIELDFKSQKTWRDRIDLLQLWFYRHTSDHHTDLPKIVSCIISTIGIFGFLYFCLNCLQQVSFFEVINPCGLTLSVVASIISLPFFVFEKKPFLHFKRYALFLSGISIFWIVCCKPKLIFGVTNLMGSENYAWFQNILLVVYTLIMIVLIFSLQKTARKNSIIPS